jgi:DNA-binding transcriptional LysR family regulator
MDWNDLRFVLAIARAGTLSAAARRLGVDQTTVARRLKAAETALAARLFDRIDGGFRPTSTGAAAIARAAAVEHELATLAAAVAGGDAEPSGTVRVTAVPILVNRVLVPATPSLRRAAPLLRLELIADNRDLSLARREADVAVRLTRPRDGAMLARRIGRLDYAAYAPRTRAPKHLDWITYGESFAYIPQARWIAAQARTAREKVSPLAVNDAEALLQAVRAGLGKSVLPCFVGDADRALARIGGSAPVLARDIWLLVQRELRHLARVEAVIAWIEASIAGLRKAGLREAGPRDVGRPHDARPGQTARPGARRGSPTPDE